ncbi:MAG: hypothetical protein ABJA98_17565 [Acidobacteriota bacterium]
MREGLIFLRRTSYFAFLIAPLVLAAGISVAQSQPPPPRATDRNTQQQKQSTGAKAEPATDLRGTEQSPVIVKIQPTPQTDEEAAKEKNKERRQSTSERWTFVLAVATVCVGFMQVLMIGVQSWIADRQNKIMKTQSTIMTDQKAAASEQAGYMRDGLAATKIAADAAKAGADTATTALNIANRPRLVIRQVVTDGFSESGNIRSQLTNGYISVTNIGVFDATLEWFYTNWLFVQKLPMENLALSAEGNPINALLHPAAFVALPLPNLTVSVSEFLSINNAVDGAAMGLTSQPEGSLFLVGYIKYRDSIALRRIHFAYRYDASLHYFVAVEHPSYSYED